MPSATTKVHSAARKRADRVLLERYHRTGDRRVRDELVNRFMPLARKLARRYCRGAEPLDDLTQVAAIGLLKAVERFDPSRGIAFTSYAVPTITGELKRYFRDHSWAVRPPRDLQELTLRVDQIATELTRKLERSPTTAELSEAAGLTDEQLLEVIQARSARSAVSLQASAGADGESGTLEAWIGHDDGGIESAETHAVLDALLTSLTARERAIVRMRFDKDMTQVEIGAIVGVSQMQISRIIRQSLDRLRHVADHQQQAMAVPSRGSSGY
ncbi:MAG: SigB/SigF/SigG family RNA polymerase sigma factor [Actinomycetota bacterium]|nr:SigB/SigF/SigG family RNA polymerase sigma factor [Actinomycetota bacterium]